MTSTTASLVDLFEPPEAWQALDEMGLPSVTTFLLHEAELLDAWQLEEWLDLFADDCIYWVPIAQAAVNPSEHLNLIYDNRALLEDRVYRLETGKVPSQDPPSRTLRSLTNFTACRLADGGVLVRSVLSLYEQRPRGQRHYVARCTHRLSPTSGHWKIAGKKVLLLNSDEWLPSLTILL